MNIDYDAMQYRRCGKSGVLLPAVSLGFWHNFGTDAIYSNCREMVLGAFERGITHFDLANNYGPVPGSAEETIGRIFKNDLAAHRDEMLISSKAGFLMWDGPYGEWGSRKHMISSLDQSLKRMGLDYVDIFYHHRADPDTPLEETMGALRDIVKSGKALYVGLSNYKTAHAKEAIDILKGMGVHCLLYQMNYSIYSRAEEASYAMLAEEGVGTIVYSPLAQGLLTDRYFNGIPEDSRDNGNSKFLTKEKVDPAKIEKSKQLNALAEKRGQSLAQLALAWVLRKGRATSVIIGASKLSQIQDNIGAIGNLDFTDAELAAIDKIVG
jgi:L-glyceraldehyde 3-phosphate reductase